MVRFLVIINSPFVRTISPEIPNVILSPSAESRIACRREPGPPSPTVETVQTAVAEAVAADNRSAATTTEKGSHGVKFKSPVGNRKERPRFSRDKSRNGT